MKSTASEVRCPQVVDAFAALVDTFVDGYDVVNLLNCLVDTCTRLPAVDAAGITLSDGHGDLQVMAYTTAEILPLELEQLQTQEGPSVDCFRTSQVVSAPDLTQTADRWPRFGSRAVQDGFRAVHALPMRLRTETIGGLSLFTARPGPLSPDDLRISQALADVATIGILHERALRSCESLAKQLQTAFNSRVFIEQAKGLLAERGGLDFAGAFALLRAHARRKRLRIGEVARGVVEGSITIDIPPRDAR